MHAHKTITAETADWTLIHWKCLLKSAGIEKKELFVANKEAASKETLSSQDSILPLVLFFLSHLGR